MDTSPACLSVQQDRHSLRRVTVTTYRHTQYWTTSYELCQQPVTSLALTWDDTQIYVQPIEPLYKYAHPVS